MDSNHVFVCCCSQVACESKCDGRDMMTHLPCWMLLLMLLLVLLLMPLLMLMPLLLPLQVAS